MLFLEGSLLKNSQNRTEQHLEWTLHKVYVNCRFQSYPASICQYSNLEQNSPLKTLNLLDTLQTMHRYSPYPVKIKPNLLTKKKNGNSVKNPQNEF